MGKWDRFKGQLSLSRSTKVIGKENNYRNALSVSNIIVSRLQFFFFFLKYRDTCKLYRDTNRVTSIAMNRADTSTSPMFSPLGGSSLDKNRLQDCITRSHVHAKEVHKLIEETINAVDR